MVSRNVHSGRGEFARRLRTATETCRDCGFEGSILGSAWWTTAAVRDRDETVVYRLRCPDCGTERTVALRLP